MQATLHRQFAIVAVSAARCARGATAVPACAATPLSPPITVTSQPAGQLASRAPASLLPFNLRRLLSQLQLYTDLPPLSASRKRDAAREV
jgi:hypothetical protein